MKKILFSCLVIGIPALVGCSSKVQIGDYAHGGIVAWIDWKGEHGIVCPANDLVKVYNWDGAKKKCSELIINGKNDWYLPSKSELHKLYLNLHKNGLGNFKPHYNYWSSTEKTTSNAYYFSFKYGCSYFLKYSKNDIYLVRAVRVF